MQFGVEDESLIADHETGPTVKPEVATVLDGSAPDADPDSVVFDTGGEVLGSLLANRESVHAADAGATAIGLGTARRLLQ